MPTHPPTNRSSPGREYLTGFACALVLYLASVAPGPLWQDSGLAQLRVLRLDLVGGLGLALSHPLYYLVAFAFQWLPLGESALKTNLVSAVFGALTVANVYLLVRLLTKARWPAAVGAMSLAVAHTFWQHCTLAEVYTVSTALMTAELLCLVRYTESHDARWLVLMCLAGGLGVSNHMLAVLHLPVWGVLLVRLLTRRQITWRIPALCVPAWGVGASLYIALIVQAWAWGRPLADVMRSALFGTAYAENVLNAVPSARLLADTLLYLLLNYPTPTALLAVVGLLGVWKRANRTVAGCLTAVLAIHLLWAARYDVPDQYTFFIPSIVTLSVFLGVGAAGFVARRSGQAAPKWRIAITLSAVLPVAAYAALPSIARGAGLTLGVGRDLPYRDRYTYFLWPWKTGYAGAARFAKEVEAMLPAGSVLIAEDTSVRPIHYRMEAGQWRKDVDVWPRPGAVPGAESSWPDKADVADALAAGRVYVVVPLARYCPAWLLADYEFEQVGILYRVRPPARNVGDRPSS